MLLLCAVGALAQSQIVCTGSGYVTLTGAADEVPGGPSSAPIWWVARYDSTETTLWVNHPQNGDYYYTPVAQSSAVIVCDTNGDPNACVTINQGAESYWINGQLVLYVSMTGTEQ